MAELAKRRVMIGSPSYDGKLTVWYVNSLIETMKQADQHNVEIIPIWVSFDALVQRCRNDTLAIAIQQDVDDLIWIDTDIEWQPEWIFRLLEQSVDIVGGTYPKKGDREEQYVLNLGNNTGVVDPVTGLMEVAGLGTGFLRFSRAACRWLWDNSTPYIEREKNNQEKRWAFDVAIRDNDLISEDIWVCRRLADEGGFKIYLDPTITCNHIGEKKYEGNFLKWFNTYIKPQARTINSLGYLEKYNRIQYGTNPPT